MATTAQLRGTALLPSSFLLLLLIFFFLISGHVHLVVSFDKFTVGDGQGWNPNVNYTVWVEKHKPFHVGDWLVFYYPTGMADVIQVDEAGYNKCDPSYPISNYSKGRSYAFQLNHTGNYYFICSRGSCFGGMRLAIVVHHLPLPSPPPSSLNHSASPRRRRRSLLGALAASLLLSSAAALFRLPLI